VTKKRKRKKFSVTFLTDKNNNWFNTYISKLKYNLPKKYKYIFIENFRKIKKQDIVFILNYTKILSENFLKINKLNLVVHSSDLPKNRGFSPLYYQVLKNQNIIENCIIEAKKDVDDGNIFLKKKFKLNGTELSKELRSKQANTIIKLIVAFLNKYPNVRSVKQVGKKSFNKKRTITDNKIDIRKSLKSQFNLLRIVENEKYPAFFYYKKKKYVLKIYKEE